MKNQTITKHSKLIQSNEEKEERKKKLRKEKKKDKTLVAFLRAFLWLTKRHFVHMSINHCSISTWPEERLLLLLHIHFLQHIFKINFKEKQNKKKYCAKKLYEKCLFSLIIKLIYSKKQKQKKVYLNCECERLFHFISFKLEYFEKEKCFILI